MTHDQAVLDALAYRRNVGATLESVWRHVAYQTKDEQAKQRTLATLKRLEREGVLSQVGETWFFTPAGYQRAKGEQRPATWLDADAWILLAALHSCRKEPKELESIIGAADYINHAIPTHEELHGAINRLLAGRLLTTRRGKLIVTERATDLFAKVEATGRKAVLSQLGRLQRLLDCPCCGIALKAVRWRYALDADTYARAVASYRLRF
jgi:hypothetical protein